MKFKDISADFPGIYIVHQQYRGYQVGEHVHGEHEFFLPIVGDIEIRTKDKTLKAGPGQMIYLPPQESHSFKADSQTKGERLILIVNPKAWEQNDGGSSSATILPTSQLCKEILFQLLIHRQTKTAKVLTQTLLQTLAEMLEEPATSAAFSVSPSSFRTQDERVQKALSLIKENFATNISTTEIAKQSAMSLRNFNRLFIQELGMNPKQVIILYRMQKAKKLLSQGRSTVTEVAFEVGYSSVSQFIATFRKVTGQLPTSFLPLGENSKIKF